MTSFSAPTNGADGRLHGVETWRRKPVRITVTIAWETHRKLLERSAKDGRSLSNLVAFLLDSACGV
jgi:hypothetical protein